MSAPPPIEYATPHAPSRRRWIVWMTMIVVLLVLLAMMGLFLQRSVSSVQIVVTPAPTALPAPPALVAPTVPQRLTIIQRREAMLEGAGGGVLAHIGDITRDQTLLTIRDASGNPLLTTRSVQEGDVHTFTVGNAPFEIEVAELNNFLTGEDYGVFNIRAAGAPLSEAEKIEKLIAAVAGASGLAFIRNGEEHTPAAAAEHLRRKYKSANQTLTARRFVDEVASKSSLSGEEYRVKLPDGKVASSGEWFSEQLRRIEDRASAASKPAP